MNAPQPCSLKLNLDHWVIKKIKVTSVADPFFGPRGQIQLNQIRNTEKGTVALIIELVVFVSSGTRFHYLFED